MIHFGARPLRRAIMKYLEDCCAMFIKTLYPNTKIHVRRKKVEGH
jgi:ATP-dependent Clp protease ATP-binding subunit ClpA